MKNQDLKALGTANDHTVKVALSYLRALKSPLAESLAGGDFSAVVSAPFPALDDENFRDKYLAREFLRKYPFEIAGTDREGTAIKKFYEAEQQCGLQNSWLANLQADPHRAPLFLRTMREKIRKILGKFSWELVAVHSGHGKGATFRLPRARGDAYYKFGDKPDVTSTALPVVSALIQWGSPLWYAELTRKSSLEDNVQLVAGNRVTTVPKDALKDRVIAIEPTLNMYFQKGVGSLISSRLRAVGLDLPKQQDRNKSFALQGSVTGDLATIDLSSASDTVSLGLVEYLLPPEWFEAINLLRSHHGVLPNRELITYEKVASMGNGFTFELESLIFLACALTAVPDGRVNINVAVYGDDIIVPSRDAPRTLLYLDAMGFTPNTSKTFYSGPFRESCGGHYLNGVDVTPLYVKEPINTVPRLYWFANQVRRFSRLSYGLDARFKPTWDLTVSRLPRAVRGRFLIPDGVGDNGLVVDFDEAVGSVKFDRTLWQLRYMTFGESRESRVCDDQVGLITSLYKLERTAGVLPWFSGEPEEPLEYVPGLKLPATRYMRVFSHVQEWSHHGSWI